MTNMGMLESTAPAMMSGRFVPPELSELMRAIMGCKVMVS